jgi:hypothetical protein
MVEIVGDNTEIQDL